LSLERLDCWISPYLPSPLQEPGYRQAPDTAPPEDAQDAPDVILWAALITAPPEGSTVPDLMTATGMSRPRIYLRLRDLTEQGQVIQVSRGRWRAVTDHTV
jgi:hypothetical protein